MTLREMERKANDLRITVLDMVYRAQSGHLGGDYSVMETMVSLYYRQMNVSPELADDPKRDRFVLSKGHTAETLYAILADRGFFPEEELGTYCRFGSRIIGHPNNKVNGVEVNSGSLGHGLSVGVGMALAGRMSGAPYRVWVVMGDGELAEGSVWEGAMSAGHFKLDNLTAVIDRNRLQISGSTEDVMAQDDTAARWRSFGWSVTEVDGNDLAAVDAALAATKEHRGSPSLIVANTRKGKGVSFMEGVAKWHNKAPTEEEYTRAREELVARGQELI